MSKINIPQPVWPEMAIIVDNEIHRFAPRIGRDGGATYDTRSKNPEVAKRAYALLSEYATNTATKDRASMMKILADDTVHDDTVVASDVPSADVGAIGK